MSAPNQIRDAIRDARRVALLTHVHPDADCLGAAGALHLCLAALGRQPQLILPAGTAPRSLIALLQWAEIAPVEPPAAAACDLAVVLDTALARRVNLAGQSEVAAHLPTVVIDHHASNPGFGRWNWIEPDRSSTSEMVYDLAVALAAPISPPAASLLYAGIHRDTQGFSLRIASPGTLQVAAALVAAGARVAEVCELVNQRQSMNEFNLRRLVHENTRTSPGGRVAWSTTTLAELERIGCEPHDIDNQVEIVRSIDGVLIALLLSEVEPGRIRVNLRASAGASVLALAEQFGGGGHLASAGVVFKGTLAEAVAALTRAAMDQVGEA